MHGWTMRAVERSLHGSKFGACVQLPVGSIHQKWTDTAAQSHPELSVCYWQQPLNQSRTTVAEWPRTNTIRASLLHSSARVHLGCWSDLICQTSPGYWGYNCAHCPPRRGGFGSEEDTYRRSADMRPGLQSRWDSGCKRREWSGRKSAGLLRVVHKCSGSAGWLHVPSLRAQCSAKLLRLVPSNDRPPRLARLPVLLPPKLLRVNE